MGVCFILAEIALFDNPVCVKGENMVNKVGRISDDKDPFILVVVIRGDQFSHQLPYYVIIFALLWEGGHC